MSDPLDAASQAVLAARFPDRADDFFGAIQIGPTKASRTEGARLILAGIKTATGTAVWEWGDGRRPTTGALSVLFDGDDAPVAVVETIMVEPMRFGDADDALAQAYGEGPRTLDWWRRVMGGHYRALAAEMDATFDDDTVLLIERLRVVARL